MSALEDGEGGGWTDWLPAAFKTRWNIVEREGGETEMYVLSSRQQREGG
jgi:hypothetical protein